MFLLNDHMVRKYMEKKELQITGFVERSLVSTHYYFHLGEYCDIWDSDAREYAPANISDCGSRELVLPPNGVATVKSHEFFVCSGQVLGLLGISSSLLLSTGVVAHLSPTINPLFSGHLEFALQNLRNVEQSVPYMAQVGKAVFFDVSDTYPVGEEWYGGDSDKRDRRLSNGPNLMTPETYAHINEVFENMRAL